MKRQIVYLMSGKPHLPYLACSLFTLRQHWDGPVSVYAWPESCNIVRRMSEDHRLSISCCTRDPDYKGKNAQFLDKIRLMRVLKDEVNLYLDADTTIHGSLDPLFELAEQSGFCCTQFNDWVSTGRIVRKRVGRLRKFPAIDQRLIDSVLTNPWPSVNGGVFAACPDSPVLALWEEWTVEALSIFIADEAILHLMVPKFFPAELQILRGGEFNCSPMRFQPKGLRDEDVVVRHFHGDSNVRLNKSRKGWDLWSPVWREVLRENIGGAQEWKSVVGNKYLDRVEKELGYCADTHKGNTSQVS